jgi:C1A family cysteine protease
MPGKSSPRKFGFGFGWTPDVPDHRDHTYAAPLAKLTKTKPLPAKVDLRSKCPPVYDQGNIGSCTANAIAAALQFDRKKQKLADFLPSRLSSITMSGSSNTVSPPMPAP